MGFIGSNYKIDIILKTKYKIKEDTSYYNNAYLSSKPIIVNGHFREKIFKKRWS